MAHGEARVPLPLFASRIPSALRAYSAVPLVPSLLPHYQPVKHMLVEASNWGLLLAIASLGLSTSVRTIIALGWRHIATALGTTVVIFVVVTGGLLLMRTGG